MGGSHNEKNDIITRRRAIIVTVAGVATTLSLPLNWRKPIVESVVVPAHASTSKPR
jgi:hypothetical protein